LLCWIALSSCVIFFNKHILTTLHFEFPLCLTSIHLVFQTAATRALKVYKPSLFERPVQSAQYAAVPTEMQTEDVTTAPTDLFRKRLVPIGVLFALSLWLSNLVYLYLSVSTIQIIKAGSPIAVMTVSFLFGLKQPSVRLVGIILLICTGVGIASYGSVDFNLFGFGIQVLAICIEAVRVCLIQLLLHNAGLTPLGSLHAFAPICLACLMILLLPIEGIAPFSKLADVGFFTLLLNATLTFGLNLASIRIIDLSSLVLALAKVFKDVMLVVFSALFLGDAVSELQILGYGIALGGLGLYKFYG